MGDVNWGLLAQYPNAGQAFADSFKQGMQDRQKNIAKAAMAALVKDPTNVNALGALAKVDPEKAMEFRKVQLQYGQKSDEEWKKTIAGAAKMADTPEKWDGIVDQFVAMGHPEAAQLKGKFSPQLRSAYMAQGGVSEDNPNSAEVVVTPQPGAPALIYNKATGQTRMLVAPNDGSHPVGAPAQNLPQVGDQTSYDAVPPGAQYMTPDGHIRVKGGQTGSAPSGGFPGAYYTGQH